MSKQWGAVLRGHDDDLEDWRETLKPPFDPWVEVHGPDHVLRSASLNDLTSASEVRDRVVAQIERLNGIMSVMKGCKPLQFSGVVEIAPDGKVHRTIFAELFVDLDRIRSVATVETLGPDGKPTPTPPPKPSDAQAWAAIADGDDHLEDALIYFGRACSSKSVQHPPTFWFDIFKALECLEKRAGGEDDFVALDWAPRGDVKRLKRTANWARHARRKFQKPSPATTEQEAIDSMSLLLRAAFETAIGLE